MTAAHTLSRTWLLETPDGSVRLRRPSDGTVIELEGIEPAMMSDLWAALGRRTTDVELESLFQPFVDLLPVFLEHGVLRECVEPRGYAIHGAGPVRTIVDDLVRELDWRLPPLLCSEGDPLLRTAAPHGAVIISVVSSGMAAMGLGCVTCFRLRVLGVEGEPGSEQTELQDVPPERGDFRALVATTLWEIERASLSPFQGFWVRRDVGVEYGRVLPHPDCVCLASARKAFDPAWLRADLARRSEPITAERIRVSFGDSPFAPLVIGEVDAQHGVFPFGGPYVSGDTRLSRRQRGRVFCTSIPGIVHGSASTAERSRLLAWSEGVERLAAQSAVGGTMLPVDHPGVLESCRRYGWQGLSDQAEFCAGLDLLRDVECLVPLERVVVGLPPELSPGGCSVEPTFTGAASHVTSLEAILHGSIEVLKRDAFLVAWYRKRRLAQVALPETLPPDIAERLAYLTGHGLNMRLYDLRADLPVPMLLADVRASRRVGQWPAGGAIVVPAGGFTPTDALRHLTTLICTRFVGIGLDESPERNPLDPTAAAALGSRIPFWPGLARYLNPAHADALAFLQSNMTIPLEAMDVHVPELAAERFQVLDDWMRSARLNWIAVPLSDPHVVEAGLRVTKVVIPEAIRMTLRHEDVDRKQPRFLNDYAGASPGSWNEEPHPLY